MLAILRWLYASTILVSRVIKENRKSRRKRRSRPARKALSTIFFALASRSFCKGLANIMRKSYRWYRFPCCGGAYPCPICHAESGNCKQTDILANQMICGKCSYQMAYSDSKPCRKCGFEFGMEKVSNKKNLEKLL